MKPKNQAIKSGAELVQDAESIVAATSKVLKDSEMQFDHACAWLKMAIKAHVEAEITLARLKMDQQERAQ